MDNEYYSLEVILAENQVIFYTAWTLQRFLKMWLGEQKIHCTFNIDVPGLGYLDNATDEDVRAS